MMLDPAAQLEQRVFRSVLARGWPFTMLQAVLWGVFVLGVPRMFLEAPLFRVGLAATIAGNLLLIVLLLRHRPDGGAPSRQFLLLEGASLMMGVGWSLVLADFFMIHGPNSTPTLFACLVVCALQTAALAVLTPERRAFLAFFLPQLILGCGVAALQVRDLPGLVVVAFMAGHTLSLVLSSRRGRQLQLQRAGAYTRALEEKEKAEAMLDAFPGLVSMVDERLIYQSVNRYGREIMGLAGIVGKPVGHQSPGGEFARLVEEFMRGGVPQLMREVRVEEGPAPGWFLLSLRRLQRPEGWVMLVSLPIDELVETRQQATELKSQNEQSARLASLGEMAQGLAHEINNPLAVTLFAAEEILARAKTGQADTPFLLDYGGKILNTANRIAAIIKGLRYFARDAGKDPITAVPIPTIVSKGIDFKLEKMKRYKVEYVPPTSGETLRVMCREVQMVQVLVNLLNNAFDACKNTEPAWIKIEAYQEGEHVVIAVLDSGPGVPAAAQARLMEPFFTTKPTGEGTGLGLSISHGLMKSNGGFLRYRPGTPTRFEMGIPKA